MKISEVVEMTEKSLAQSKSIMKESARQHLETAKDWQSKGNGILCVVSCLNSLYHTIGFIDPEYARVRRFLGDML
jgi:hypothetical protein